MFLGSGSVFEPPGSGSESAIICKDQDSDPSINTQKKIMKNFDFNGFA
jgi:hypothetical protein